MKDSQENNRTSGAGVAVASGTSAAERFERGIGMHELYERMRPDQRTAMAGEFIRLLTLAGDSQVEQFRQKLQDHTQITGDAANELLSAGQVEAIDAYVRQSHPEMIAQLAAHPVTRSALEMPGAPAVDETNKGAESETTASDTAYATSWDQTQQQSEEAAQRASEDEIKEENAGSSTDTEPPARGS
ncbi:MAG TPA: hypothetical protein VFS83_13595 [Ktedonobacterales bacterium]|nr:hypothetical protein [Ktedonobacterales bacterium]